MAVPTLLTPQEAADVARCSVKTVRRAYLAGTLKAHRRGGSRAVLLAEDAVMAWAQAEALRPQVAVTTRTIAQARERRARHAAGATGAGRRAPRLGAPPRFDLSMAALAARRSETVV